MEDLDDDARAIEHDASHRALEVARLAGRDLVIDGYERDARLVARFLVVRLGRRGSARASPRYVFLLGLGGPALLRFRLLARRRSLRAPRAARELDELGELAF